jgi:hypothetical protein
MKVLKKASELWQISVTAGTTSVVPCFVFNLPHSPCLLGGLTPIVSFWGLEVLERHILSIYVVISVSKSEIMRMERGIADEFAGAGMYPIFTLNTTIDDRIEVSTLYTHTIYIIKVSNIE